MKRRSFIKGLILACVTAPAIYRDFIQPPKITTAQQLIEHWPRTALYSRFYSDSYKAALEQIMAGGIAEPSRTNNPSIAAGIIPKP